MLNYYSFPNEAKCILPDREPFRSHNVYYVLSDESEGYERQIEFTWENNDPMNVMSVCDIAGCSMIAK